MKKICVLLDGPVANDGRVRRVIHSLSEHKVDLYYFGGSDADQKLFGKNVQLIHCKLMRSWLNQNLFFHRKFSDILSHSINKHYDFIYCNDYPLLQIAATLKQRIQGAKLIYDSHEIYTELFNQYFPTKGWKALYGEALIKLNHFFHKIREKKLVKEVDLFVTVCDSFKSYFEKQFHRNDILVVRNCPDIQEYKKPDKNNILRDTLNLPQENSIVLYQGMINKGRGLEKSIDIFAQIPSTIHLVIIGSGPLKKELKDRVKFLALTNVHFIETLPFNDLLYYTASADLGLLFIDPINLSKRLTLPNKVFEYMYAGIPIISNSLPEVTKIITETNCGYIAKKEDATEFTSIIEEIKANQQEFQEKGKRGFDAIVEKYNWENEVEKLKQLLIIKID